MDVVIPGRTAVISLSTVTDYVNNAALSRFGVRVVAIGHPGCPPSLQPVSQLLDGATKALGLCILSASGVSGKSIVSSMAGAFGASQLRGDELQHGLSFPRIGAAAQLLISAVSCNIASSGLANGEADNAPALWVDEEQAKEFGNEDSRHDPESVFAAAVSRPGHMEALKKDIR